MPPPCAAEYSSGQVSAPGSPLRGVVFQRHCTSPRLRIARLEVAGHVERVAAHAEDHVVADHDRRRGREVLALHAGDFLVPALLARRRVERDEVVVGREEIQPVAVHADAAVADVDAAPGPPEVVPQLAAGARVDRPDVVGRGEVQDAVHQQRRRLDGQAAERGHAAARRRRLRPFAADHRARPARCSRGRPRPARGSSRWWCRSASACCSAGPSSRRGASARRRRAACASSDGSRPSRRERGRARRRRERERERPWSSFQAHQVGRHVVHVAVGPLPSADPCAPAADR